MEPVRLAWTPEAEKNLSGRAAPKRLEKPEALWSKLREGLAPTRWGMGPLRATLTNGQPEAPPDLAQAMGAALAWIDRDAMPDAPPDAEALAVLAWAVQLWSPARVGALLELLVRRFGADLALEASVRQHGLQSRRGAGNHVVPERKPQERALGADALRRAMLVAAPEARAQCALRARALFEGATRALRTSLAYAFFDAPELAEQVACEWLADTSAKSVPVGHLLASLRDLALVERVLAKRTLSYPLVDLVATFGERALPLLFSLHASPRDKHELAYVSTALSVFVSEDVARAFAAQIGKAEVREVAVEYFLAHPELAPGALSDLAKKKTRPGTLAAELLQRCQRGAAAARAEAAPEEAGGTAPSEQAGEAAEDELPWVLVKPPWAKAKRPRRSPRVIDDLAPLARAERLQLGDGLLDFGRPRGKRPMTADEVAAWQAKVAAGEKVNGFASGDAGVPDALVLEHWNAGTPNVELPTYNLAPTMAATFGEAALPGLHRWLAGPFQKGGAATTNHYEAVLLRGLDSPRAAIPMMQLLLGGGPKGALAWEWLRRWPDAAAVGLVPVGVGSSELREDAERTLRRLARAGHEGCIRAVAGEHGRDVAAAVDEILAADPRWDCPTKAPKLAGAWRPETFTRPRTRTGKLLPLSALERLGEMLVLSPHDPPYAGLADVRDACEPRSLAELAWDAERAWEAAGRKKRDDWMLWSIAHLADDEVIRRTTPAIKDDRILEVLATVATDAAAMELATLIARAKHKEYAWAAARAEKHLEALAARRGIPKEELDDTIVPTLDLDAEGGVDLDYGSRTLRVGFDSRLEPWVLGEKGEHLRQLPPKKKTDDPEKVKLAKQRWSELKEDVATVASRRAQALEAAMIRGRTWTADAFRATWVEHPLARHLAHGVVWLAHPPSSQPGGAPIAFRVAEDQSLADVNDAAFSLAADARVGVAHPIELGPEGARAWGTILGDYELLQPFEQLARPVVAVPATGAEIAVPLSAVAWHALDAHLQRHGFRIRKARGTMVRDLFRGPPGVAVVTFRLQAPIVEARVRFELADGSSMEPAHVSEIERAEVVHAVTTAK